MTGITVYAYSGFMIEASWLVRLSIMTELFTFFRV